MDFEIKSKEEFIDKFLSEYFSRPFGSFSKRELDVLLMHLVLDNSELSNYPNHELSILFQISETRIKNLRHEAQLRYIEDSGEYIKKNFFKVLKRSKFQSEQKKIVFVVEDSYLKQGIQARLKKLGHFADNSFNSEIVKISFDSFVALLESFYTEEDIQEFEKKINEVMGSEDKINFKALLKMYLEGAATRAGEKTIDIGAMCFTGGVSEIGGLTESVGGFFKSDS